MKISCEICWQDISASDKYKITKVSPNNVEYSEITICERCYEEIRKKVKKKRELID